MRFVDANVLLYAISTAPEEQEKSRIARGILEAPDLALSVPVLQKFYVQATHPTRPDRIEHGQAAALIESFLRYPVQETTVSLMNTTLAAKQRFGLSLWDAAVVEAARAMSCSEVLTEDLNDGQDYAGVRVVNPFR